MVAYLFGPEMTQSHCPPPDLHSVRDLLLLNLGFVQ